MTDALVSSSEPTTAGRPTETLKVQDEALVEKVRGFLHEGSVRRVVIRNDAGHPVIEIPVNVGVLAAVIAPALVAVGAIAAVASDWQIEVVRDEPQSGQ